jgi:AcrR family transcriptional regulator
MKTRFVRGAETRLRILGTAADLFHKQGVRATSPDEVIEASRTGKGQFYHYFKSKEGLVHEVLQAHLEAIKNRTAPPQVRNYLLEGLGKMVPCTSRTAEELRHDTRLSVRNDW